MDKPFANVPDEELFSGLSRLFAKNPKNCMSCGVSSHLKFCHDCMKEIYSENSKERYERNKAQQN